MGTKKKENEKLEQKAKAQKFINIILVVVIIISLIVISIVLNTRGGKTLEELDNGNSDTSGDNYNLTKAEKDIEEKFLIADKPVLVDYYADWCGPCVMMAPIIEELQKNQEDFYVQKVDVDKYGNLASKAGAYSIPYFVLYNNGEFVASTVGVQTKESLIDFVKNNIKE